MSTKVTNALKSVRDLIIDPARWAQNGFAFDKAGNRVAPASPDAACWCVTGAVIHVEPDIDTQDETGDALEEAAFNLYSFQRGDHGPGRITTAVIVNDELGHAAVIQMLDAAIIESGKTRY